MKKHKIITILIAPCIFCLLFVLMVVVFVCKPTNKPKIHNLFDQIYYEVIAVKNGNDSILLSGPNSAKPEYDMRRLEGVRIEENDYSYFVSYNYYSYYSDEKELKIYIHKNGQETDNNLPYVFIYRLNERKVTFGLYTESFDPLLEAFLPDYFKWYSNSGKENPYSINDLGDVTFEES